MPYKPIRDYGIIGDGHTAALVDRDGSIDWCCWPQFDSEAVFCRLLDAKKGGYFRVGPAGRYSSSRAYAEETNVLASDFATGSGQFRLTDFMPIVQRTGRIQGRDLDPSHRILRLLEGLHGSATVEIVFRPTFQFARAKTRIAVQKTGATAHAGRESLNLSCPVQLRLDHTGAARGAIELSAGDRIWIALTYGGSQRQARDLAARAQGDLERTLRYWEDWIGQSVYQGPYSDLVRRSVLVLKLLIFSPTGAIVAAPTTSLPERMGGVRNWDYRFAWLRDSALVVQALESVGYYDEAMNMFNWLEDLDLQNRGRFQIVYTINGKSELSARTLDHLAGYRHSRPVRTGNDAGQNKQLDIYGEVLDAAYLGIRRMKKKVRAKLWKMLCQMADGAAADWREDDRSIWEMRGGARPFLYSKLLCWVALDRGIRLANELGLPADVPAWSRAMKDIREAILRRGYDEEIGAFTQSFGSKALDASALAIPRVGFLPPGDRRVRSTIEKIRERLTTKGLVYRYLTNDRLSGREGTFTMCGFWLVDNLVSEGRLDQARELFERLAGYANDLGLLSEEIDPDSGELLGNYPQGFTHLSLIRAALNIANAERGRHFTLACESRMPS